MHIVMVDKDFEIHCNSRAHCHECRTNPEWRQAVKAPEVCPFEITEISLPKKIQTFFVAAKNWVTSGFPILKDEEFLIRKKICRKCEFWKAGKCKKCGCSTDFKMRMATERCPIGKWESVDISDK